MRFLHKVVEESLRVHFAHTLRQISHHLTPTYLEKNYRIRLADSLHSTGPRRLAAPLGTRR
jgi:hypothetical protein